jgi:molybdenum cofactor synthesis domain-containing protein
MATPSQPPRSAAALIIGNEILSGKVHEQNLVVLARALRALGIALRRVVMIADDVPLIAEEVRGLSSSYDLVFTSGGVGPTHDDLTIQAVAQAFGTEVQVEPSIEAMMRAHFGERLTPGHLLMARVPRGCELVASDSIRWPTVKMANVWVLPGVPEVFRLKLAVVTAQLTGGLPYVSRAVYTNLDEPTLMPMLERVVALFPTVEVGSYPKWKDPDCRTILTFDGLDAAAVDAARDAFIALLPEGEPQKIG